MSDTSSLVCVGQGLMNKWKVLDEWWLVPDNLWICTFSWLIFSMIPWNECYFQFTGARTEAQRSTPLAQGLTCGKLVEPGFLPGSLKPIYSCYLKTVSGLHGHQEPLNSRSRLLATILIVVTSTHLKQYFWANAYPSACFRITWET